MLRERSRFGCDTDMAGERALEREVSARCRGGLDRVHPVESATTNGGGLAVTSQRLGDARGDAVEMPGTDRPADPFDGQLQRGELLGCERELPTFDQRIYPPRQLQPLGPTGRSGACLLPGA